MYTEAAIREQIASGEITIRYAFDITVEGIPPRLPINAPVDFSKPEDAGVKCFETNFFGDRLGITMGPIVYSHRFRKRIGRTQYKDRDYCFDLRSLGAIDLEPGESITASSVEHVILKGSTAAIILPRLSVASAGAVASTTYIDPYWDGILQLHIVNEADRPISLRFGERIAVCRFYPVIGGPVPGELRERFSHKSHHYGLNWSRILDTDFDPQPLRKRPTATPTVRRRLLSAAKLASGWLHEYFGWLVGAGLISVIAAWGQLRGELKELDELRKTVRQLTESSQELEGASLRLASQLPVVGSMDLDIDSGRMQAESFQKVRRPFSPAKAAILSVEPSTLVVAVSQLRPDPDSKSTLLYIRVTRIGADSAAPIRATVHWLVGPAE
jgi:deoxycytidine triphosphate deaminase